MEQQRTPPPGAACGLPRAVRAPQDRESGMSLVEVVVAVVILAIVASAVLGVVLQAQSASVNNRARIAAANLASREIDIVREAFSRSDAGPLQIANAAIVTNPHPLPDQSAGEPLVIDGTPYTVVRSAAWNPAGGGKSACAGGLSVPYPTLGVTVSVTWPNMGTVKPVVSHAALAPKKGTGVPVTAAFVAVMVVDAEGQANPYRSVRVTAPGQTYPGLTDESGCAVVAVNPAASGTTYTAELTDTGFVDVNGMPNPSKTVGLVTKGQLNNGVKFWYDRAATLRLRVVDDLGALVDDSVVAGSQVTVVVTMGSSGSDSKTPWTVAGAETVLSGLWPTRYGAFYGVTAPVDGYPTVQLGPGATASLDVTIAMASGSIIDLPPGVTSVTAVAGAGECTAAGARLVAPAGFTLVPGAWSFYASGDTFDCSPGPSAWSLQAGTNDPVPWGSTTLQVDEASPVGHLWALHASKVAGPLTTCPAAGAAGAAVDVQGARGAAMPIVAGTWYVYRTDGSPDGLCLGTPPGQYPKVLDHGQPNVLTWTAP